MKLELKGHVNVYDDDDKKISMFPVNMIGEYYPLHNNALHRVINIVNTYDLDNDNAIRNNVLNRKKSINLLFFLLTATIIYDMIIISTGGNKYEKN